VSVQLSSIQRERLGAWRDEVANNDYVLMQSRIDAIQAELQEWLIVAEKDPADKFFEVFRLIDADGNLMDTTVWRGVCHWLNLRHGCVHGLLFTPARLAVLQQRSASVRDSPNRLDMTFSGHMGTQGVMDAVRAEAQEEGGLILDAESGHVADPDDLGCIHSYDYVEPPRPADEFYNVERRFVFAIRLTDQGLGSLSPVDGEVSSFSEMPIDEVWRQIEGGDVASALLVSGPMALHHAAESWKWH
jgi:hypothetical protein